MMADKTMKKRLIILAATVFFVGYIPLAPGTWGSLVGVLIYLFLRGNTILHLASVCILFSAGLLVCGKAGEIFGRADDKRIVIDETFAVLLLFLFMPNEPLSLIGGFVLYRFFDIIKPFPTRKLERFPHSWGVMLDDIAAVCYSLVCVYILLLGVKFFSEI